MIIAQRSLAGGEISPSLYARVDTVKYATGLRTCRNALVMRHGGVSNRPGTEFVAEIRNSAETARLFPFVFNNDQTYVLEFTAGRIRIHRNGATVSSSDKTITGISNANPAVVTSAAHGLANDDEVFLSGIVGPIGTYLNNRNFKVGGVTANTFTLRYMDNATNVNSTAFGAYTSGGFASLIYEITSPYNVAILPAVQYVQSADVMTFVHNDVSPRELSRTGHASWTLTPTVFEPTIAAPGSVVNTGAAGSTTEWKVTAIESETYQESLGSAATGTSAAESTLSGTPITISWAAVSGAVEYNVYRSKNGVFGFVGTAGSTSFTDNGITPDTSDTPPVARNPFGSINNWPAAVGYIQQRKTFGNTYNDPQKVWMSRSAQFENFTVSSPLQDDDAVTFSLVGRQVNSIKHFLDIGTFVTLTSGGEWTVNGDSAGIIKPGEINPKQQSYNGSSTLAPLIIGGTALYLQARGSVVRDLAFELQADGYRGNDLTIFAAHLFDQYTIVDWAYQQIPHSIVWAVRDDGVLLGLTYVREHQVAGWHRHDFNGFVENVCVVPEGNEDVVYLIIKRTINGQTKRYIERMHSRQIDDVIDSVFMDCSLTYDGRNTDSSHTMTLSGGTAWTYQETLTLTSSTSFFFSNRCRESNSFNRIRRNHYSVRNYSLYQRNRGFWESPQNRSRFHALCRNQ